MRGRKANLVNRVFNRLRVLEFSSQDKHGHSIYLCECQCGRQLLVRANNLLNGRSQSCGCYRKERISENRNKPITWQGQTLKRAEWEEKLGLSPGIITRRIKLGWSLERAMSTPLGKRVKRKAKDHDRTA